ncbi:MAG: outer membrane protein assembly factor BamD [Micavibrio sp.]|nr:outer membrane protein assembly factor BamD [Micavibrio sp.]
MKLSRFVLSSLAVLMLAGCASDGKDEVQIEESAEVLYSRAAKAMDEGDYRDASMDFEEVERQHPYSQWATRAQLMAAYAYYKNQNYDEAIMALDRFIELHPGSDDIDYAHYLKALCYYEQITDVARDQEMTRQAMAALEALIRRFPDSKYTRDATLKYDLTNDHLAGKEMEIGRYYLNRGHVNASLNRFKTVVEDYQTTSHVAEALHRLVEAYLTLGLTQEATKVAAVLGYNYPGSEWYKRSYDLLDDQQRAEIISDRGIVDRTIDSIFKPD